MAKRPMMPLWTDALVADTTHLSAAQFGAYMLILTATWRNNGEALPDNDVRLARICRMRLDTWRRYYRNVLVDFFDINDGLWHQKRLESEYNKSVAVSKFRSPKNGTPLGSKPLKSANSHSDSRARDHIHIHKRIPSSSSESVAARDRSRPGGVAPAHDAEPGTWKPLGTVLGHPTEAPPPTPDNLRAEQRQRHMQFLQAQGSADDLELYLAAQMSDDPDAAQRMTDLVEAWMLEAAE